MIHFKSFIQEVRDGIEGKNSGIPMGFNRLNKHISIRKSTYYLIGGYTGSGKTSFVDDAFVLNPIDFLIKNPNSGLNYELIYFSMERRKNFKIAKWVSRKIFLDTGKIIPVAKILGWLGRDNKMVDDEFRTVDSYGDYIEEMFKRIVFIGGPQNPTGIRNDVDEYAKRNGTLEKTDKYSSTYIPNDPTKITLIISDHVGLTKGERDYPKGKPAIDKSSEDKQRFRDLYGFSPVDVSQFNRDIANPIRIKNGDVEPMLEDFKETGSTQENADIVLSLFDPFRYKVDDPSGYELEKLRDFEGKKKYRSLKILKNSYGSDDIRIGLAFQPEIGLFKEMPKFSEMTDNIYDSILDDTYFL
jgi:replicative DNA helicase